MTIHVKPKSQLRQTALGLALLAGVALLYTWGQWNYFTRLSPGGNDLLCHYSLWQACFKFHLNPYSDQAAFYSQLAIYGRAALPGEDQNILVYPFYSVLIYGPFTLFDFPVARAMFMTLLQAAVIGGVALTLPVLGWRPPPWLTAALLGWAVLNYPEARAVLIGQFAPLGFLALAGALSLLKHKRDGWGGLLLVLATVKPTLVYLVIPFLLLWALAWRRWRFILGLGGGVFVLSALSFLALPTWVGDWLQRVSGYTGYRATQGVVWQVTHVVWPSLGQSAEIVLIGVLAVGLGWQWWQVLRERREIDAKFLWTLGVTIVVSFLVDAHTASPNYVLMLIPTLQVFAALDRGGRAGRVWIVLIMVGLLVGQWWLHLATVNGNAEQAAVFFPWPVGLGLALVLGRRWLVTLSPREQGAL